MLVFLWTVLNIGVKYLKKSKLNHKVNACDFEPNEYDNGTDFVQEPWGRFLSAVRVTCKASCLI
jgi:hypothetical protein